MLKCFFNVLLIVFFLLLLKRGKYQKWSFLCQLAGGACRSLCLIDSSCQAARVLVLHRWEERQTCAVAYMTWADSVLLVVLKSEDHTSISQDQMTCLRVVLCVATEQLTSPQTEVSSAFFSGECLFGHSPNKLRCRTRCSVLCTGASCTIWLAVLK